MKIIHEERLIDAGNFSLTTDWNTIYADIIEAIATIRWPTNGAVFSLNPIDKGNGVKPIKTACMDHLAKRVGYWNIQLILPQLRNLVQWMHHIKLPIHNFSVWNGKQEISPQPIGH